MGAGPVLVVTPLFPELCEGAGASASERHLSLWHAFHTAALQPQLFDKLLEKTYALYIVWLFLFVRLGMLS